jgi:hypothetical protein
MQPTSRILIERIAEALETTVLPVIPPDEKWASSTVRSAMTLLGHLAKRVEREGGILAADNEDARAVLNEVLPQLRDGEDAAIKDDIEAVLRDGGETPYDVPAMDALNTRYQSLFDRLLRDQYGGSWTDDGSQPVRAAIRSYLKRRMERERDLVFPEFAGPPF